VALLTLSCSREAAKAPTALPPQAVRAVKATSADVPLEISSIGNVEASSTVEVKARVTSPITKVRFAEGEEVRQGQLLFELDAEPFIRQLAEIEANIARDIANAKQAEANIARDVASLKNLDSIASRTLKLFQEGIASREQADQAQSSADAAKSNVDAGRAALESAKAAEKADRARLNETRLQIDYTKISAPISGRAGAIATKEGSLAKQNDNTLVTLLQSAPVHVSFSVPEDLLPQIRKFQSQQRLQVTATAGDQSRTGTLEFIDNTVDSTTGGIRLKATFANTDRVLWPGQFVNVTAKLNTQINAVLVSSQAVQTGPNGKYVWIYNSTDSTVKMRDVTVMRLYNPTGQTEQAVLSSGLQPGELVISEGQKRLTPNAKVRLLPNAVQASAN
jgi:multidrug efflux system membrane fusion protein